MKRKKPASRKKDHAGGGFLSAVAGVVWGSFLKGHLRGILILGIIVLVAGLAIEWIAQQAKDSSHFTVHPKALQCISRPSWLASSEHLTAQIVGDVQRVLDRCPPASIFDERIERLFREDPSLFGPWIRSVEVFERLFPSQYRVKLKLRRPVAIFVHEDRSYLIDGLGVVITSLDRLDRGEIRAALPVITGFRQAGVVREGQVPLNRRLLEGAAVAREIEVFHAMDLSSRFRVVEIDVSGHGRGKAEDVILLTDRNLHILWGRSLQNNPRFKGIDPSPQKKAANLQRVLKERPGLEGVAGVNLAFDEPYLILKEGG